jgi:hypothetical protein
MAKPEVREWAPEEGKPAEREKPPKPKHTEKSFVGKKVLIQFLDGSSFTGTLLELHTYTLACRDRWKTHPHLQTRDQNH